MPAIAVGRCNLDDVMRAIHDAADRDGVTSRACIITPALIGVQEEDLHRLSVGTSRVVSYDGTRLWIRGVDFAVRR